MNIDLKYIFFARAFAHVKVWNTFLVGKMHVLPVACFGGRVLRRAGSIDRKKGCAITSVPNVS
jgi:hypothetical protein